MAWKRYLFLLCVSMILPVTLFAQDICLSHKTSDSLDYQTRRVRGKKGERTKIPVWIKKDGVVPQSCPQDGSSFGQPLAFRNRYWVVSNNYRKKGDDGRRWSLLLKGDEAKKENLIGWVSHDDLLFNSFPLKNSETEIDEKVLIREGDRNQGKALRVFLDPDLERTVEGIEVRTVFYVYDYFPRGQDGVGGSPASEKTKSLLVSPQPFLGHEYDKAHLLIGWIDRKKVSFWNSRLAVEFSVGNNVKLARNPGSEETLFHPSVNRPLRFDALRNPVLKAEGDYYKIGAFAELDATQLQLRDRIRETTMGLEVLFIIDGTRSMKPAFVKTLEGVNNIADDLLTQAEEKGLNVPSFGVLFYRDDPNISPKMYDFNGELVSAEHLKYCSQEITPYRISSARRFKKKLKNHTACDADNSFLESVYKGVISGVQKGGFTTGEGGKPKGLRVVIHIGDAGDHGLSRFNSNHVVQTLRNYHIHRYIAIDVSNESNSFSQSVQPIIQAFEKKGILISNPSDLAASVQSKLKEVQAATTHVAETIKTISRGFAGTGEAQAGVIDPEISEYAKKIIEANNIQLSQYDVFQQYVEGYISKHDQFEKRLLIKKTQIEDLVSLLNKLIRRSTTSDREKVWNQVLKGILGEESCKENGVEISLEKCNKKNKGIPIRAGFMKFTKTEFLNLNGNDARRVACQAKVFKQRLSSLQGDKLLKSIKWNKNSKNCKFKFDEELDLNGDGLIVRDEVATPLQNGRRGTPRPQREGDIEDKFFFSEAEEEVGWIPLEHFEGDIKGQNEL